MDRVGFAGDWHGNFKWARNCIRAFASQGIGTVFHLGDFGLWPGADGEEYLQRLHQECDSSSVALFITLGNHEDYDRVSSMSTDGDGWMFIERYPLFRFAPRGHIWEHSGALFASLGGAVSIDRGTRIPGRTWWPDEAIGENDVAALRRNLNAFGGGVVDIMLTHDAPAGVTRQGIVPRPSWVTEEIEFDAWQGRLLLAEACDVAQPRSLLHGHWHEWHHDVLTGAGYVTEVWALPEDGNWRNCISGIPTPGIGITEATYVLTGGEVPPLKP